MKKSFLLLSVLLSLSSGVGAKDNCSADLRGMPLAEVWTATNAEFRQKFRDEDSVLIRIGKMDAMGNFTILKFSVGVHEEPIDAGFYESTVNDTGTREFKRGAFKGTQELFAELKAMKLNGMKSKVTTDSKSCPPILPDAALYFVETRLGKGNSFGFYGYPYQDKRYTRIIEIVDSFRTSKN